jgi:hypothetical protein
MWLTALGVALFVAVAVAWAAFPSTAAPPSGAPETSASGASSGAPSPPAGGLHR